MTTRLLTLCLDVWNKKSVRSFISYTLRFLLPKSNSNHRHSCFAFHGTRTTTRDLLLRRTSFHLLVPFVRDMILHSWTRIARPNLINHLQLWLLKQMNLFLRSAMTRGSKVLEQKWNWQKIMITSSSLTQTDRIKFNTHKKDDERDVTNETHSQVLHVKQQWPLEIIEAFVLKWEYTSNRFYPMNESKDYNAIEASSVCCSQYCGYSTNSRNKGNMLTTYLTAFMKIGNRSRRS
jgi:hypothetical protein